jgi:hypothetical protein
MKMDFKKIRPGILCGLLAICGVASAMESDVGRATVFLTGNNWLIASDEKLAGTLNGGETPNFEIKQKTWFLTDGAQKIKAILRVRGIGSGITSNYGISFGSGCKKNDHPSVYTKDFTNGSLRQLDCLNIYNISNSNDLLNQVYKVEQGSAKDKSMQIPTKGTFLTYVVSMSSGTFLDIAVFADEDWIGSQGEAVDGIPAVIKPEIVAWANEMAKASRSSVRSFSGKMIMPSIEFKQ